MNTQSSFFNRSDCAITLLDSAESIEGLLELARTAQEEGADAAALEISYLPLEDRTVENFRRVITSVPLPFMFICYRNDKFLKDNDDARQVYLKLAAKAGAEVIDVMGDLFAPAPRELTIDPAAIEKQKELIAEIHSLGAKVIMSSHFTTGTMTPDEVLSHIRAQRSRGADICKLVTRADNEEELHNAIGALCLLKREFHHPYVFLCGGKFGRLIRYMGCQSGVAIEFAVRESKRHNPASIQPSIKSLRCIRENLDWTLAAQE